MKIEVKILANLARELLHKWSECEYGLMDEFGATSKDFSHHKAEVERLEKRINYLEKVIIERRDDA